MDRCKNHSFFSLNSADLSADISKEKFGYKEKRSLQTGSLQAYVFRRLEERITLIHGKLP